MAKHVLPASIYREGRLITPDPDGKPVELTDDEVKALERHHGPAKDWPKLRAKGDKGGKPHRGAPLPEESKSAKGKGAKGS